MKIYYARPITHYNTPDDNQTIINLEDQGFIVCNPNDPLVEAEYKEFGFQVFFKLIDGCQGLFYKSFDDGVIGAGVAAEIVEIKGSELQE